MPKLNVDLHGLSHIGNLSKGYFLTTIINEAIPFLILPILTRYLSPAEYGNLALFSFYLALTNTMSGSSMQVVVSKHFFKIEKEKLAEIIGNGIVIGLLLSTTIFLLLLVSYPFTKDFLNLDLFWLLIIPPISLAYMVFYIGLGVMRNSNKVATFGKYKVGNTVYNVTISLILVVALLWGWQGRATGIIGAYLISGVLSFIYLRKKGYVSFKVTKNKLKQVSSVLFPLMPNAFQSIFISRIGIFFMQYYFTKELLGLYTIGFQIAIMLQILIATLAMSWSPYLYQQLSKKEKINKIYLTRLLYVLIGIVLLGALFINTVAGFILKVMTTQEYYDAAQYIPYFTIGYVFFGGYKFLFPILIDGEKQKYISLINIINIVLMLGLNFWFVHLFGHIGIAYAFCVTYFSLFMAFFIKSQQVMPLPWLKSLKIWK